MTGTHIDELLTEITGSPRRPLHRVMGDDTRIATLGQEMNDFVAAVGGVELKPPVGGAVYWRVVGCGCTSTRRPDPMHDNVVRELSMAIGVMAEPDPRIVGTFAGAVTQHDLRGRSFVRATQSKGWAATKESLPPQPYLPCGIVFDVALKLERGRVSLRLLHGPNGFPALPWNFSPSPASYDLPPEYEGLWRPWVKLVCPCAVKLSPLPKQLEF